MDSGSFDAITFDCYGTLIDWESGILGALRPILAAHGQEPTDDRLLESYARAESAIQGGPYLPYRDVLARVMDRLGEQYDLVPSRAERGALADSIADWQPFHDTVEALQSLARGCRLGILSNIDDALFEGSRRQLGVDFSWVVTAEQVGDYKPSRRNFETLLAATGLQPGRILHVAQSLFHDVAPAGELGFQTVWINRRAGRSGGGATPPAAAVPDLELPDLASLARLLSRRRGG